MSDYIKREFTAHFGDREETFALIYDASKANGQKLMRDIEELIHKEFVVDSLEDFFFSVAKAGKDDWAHALLLPAGKAELLQEWVKDLKNLSFYEGLEVGRKEEAEKEEGNERDEHL